MAAQEAASSRSVRLSKYFNQIIHGKRPFKNTADGNRFLEALCDEKDASKRVESLIASPEGLNAIAKSVRLSLHHSFLNGRGTDLLLYLCDPSLKQLCSGQFLYRVLDAIVEPPSFWNALVGGHNSRILTDRANHAFAWLLLEILSSHTEALPDVRTIAKRVTKDETLTNSPSLEVRNLGQKIKHVLNTTSAIVSQDGPGGRHDNDFVDFRKIKILPTPDEFASAERPFYRRADAVHSMDLESRGAVHLDNQFRLLREDLLGELRSDFQIATGQKKGSRRNFVVPDLVFDGVDCGPETRRKFCRIRLRCQNGIPQMARLTTAKDRKEFVKENRNFIRHQSFGCLISEGNVAAFATVDRDEDLLACSPPVLVLRIDDQSAFNKALLVSTSSTDLRFVQVDTAVFAYEPILKCLQKTTELPLQEQIIDLQPGSSVIDSNALPTSVINRIRQDSHTNLRYVLRTTKSIQLDSSQAESLLNGLTKKVSLIQGPPGTGKSFIGALLAKAIHDHTKETVLVICYTNHALDQFLEDLLDIGIAPDSIVRLGSKSTSRTESLNISKQRSTFIRSRESYNIIDDQKSLAEGYYNVLASKVDQYRKLKVSKIALLEYLEFSDDPDFFDAFVIPEEVDGMELVGSKGRALNRFYLLDRWSAGWDAGVYKDFAAREHPSIWKMDRAVRNNFLNQWVTDMLKERVSEIGTLMQNFDQCYGRIGQLFREKDAHTIREKRVIGCTTTAAAMKTEELQNASPGVILVEEAGEILESHILTAMTRNTKQLVLIGDHKQLRPKVNNYALTVEKGEGYNLNQSLFERLVLAGVPHTVLNTQHRMRPELSSLIRKLTYPELEDAPKTQNRPSLRGFQNNVMFVSHSHPELEADRIADRRDENAKSSKENEHEVDMVLKCVRYLGQQGYGTDQLVILTPYLGQLFLLRRKLMKDNDPILNDLDSWDLIRAGLMSPAAAKISKRPIKISTIDNYQGEESDIVIASLTRSNAAGEIGFMASPQRVNVLLSRARNALIMIGNAETFMTSRKGKDVWIPLMEQLKRDGHVYDGVPVKCERHPDKTALLSKKEDFDMVCPDGGCSEPCGTMLNCGVHVCPQRCHQLHDHSKMACTVIIKSLCPQKHKISRRCHDKNAAICRKCEAEARKQEEKRQRDHELDQQREAKQRAYTNELAELQAEIEQQRRLMKDDSDERERKKVLIQHRQDLANLKEAAKNDKVVDFSTKPVLSQSRKKNKENQPPSSTNQSSTSDPTPPQKDDDKMSNSHETSPENDWEKSESKEEWEYQKEFEGQENEALDALMDLIGLEAVKQQFITLKNKVDTAVRQNVSLKDERFGAALLGNPGTGKTTVARLYAKFLVKVGALPGDLFVETSGSGLANDGVNACKKHIEDILNNGGGVFFIDEAYQLVSGHSYGGKAVLDYLLAEIENLTGKVVFVLAGYNKQMEAFFSHNPGIPSRIPIQMEFNDYEDGELLRILRHAIDSKYKGAMKVEVGMDGLYLRIISRRIGRGRGRDGFGNAREVQNKLAQITERQAERLRKERRAHKRPDDNILTKEDLIGPEPSAALRNNAAWSKLQKLIGLKAVKQSVQVLLDGIQYNYRRELEEKPLVEYSLNRCFVGSPGTGKTSVAKLYGKILADIGLLSNGEVDIKNPADFVGSVLGQTESNTKGILASTVGKVLIIDEAYMLAGRAGSTADPYKSAVIDTIVAEVQSTPGEDRCVLLLGYKDEMEEMFRDVNPGLARRFPLDSAFVFEDFNDVELRQILDMKLKTQGFEATGQAKKVAMDMLRRARNRPHFGNAGEVDIILDKAKALHQKHMSTGKSKHRDKFEAIDFDLNFDRGECAATNLPLLFQGVVGCEEIIKQLQNYQTTAVNMKALGMDPKEQIPFNFLFKGPPGTGKTTTARRMGKVFFDMGFLANAQVEECSVTDMIGQYVGQTGPKVQKLLEKALGKVLFIDEAYRLAEGGFATEAMDELVDCLTKPKFAQKLVTILAGYDEDINRLMSINPGLTSRFPEAVIFRHLKPDECLRLLTDLLKKRTKAPLDLSVLSPPSETLRLRLLQLFEELAKLSSWGNARDVQSIEKSIFSKLISTAKRPITKLVLAPDVLLDALETMLSERSQRSEAVGLSRHGPNIPKLPKAPPQTQDAPQVEIATDAADTMSSPGLATPEDEMKKMATQVQETDSHDPRDPSVSDATWHQLQRDKLAAKTCEREHQRLEQEIARKEEEATRAKQELEDLKKAKKDAADDEERRRREAERIKRVLEMRKREEKLAELKKQRREAEIKRERERSAQKKLRDLGVCVAGFRWIKQMGGYRCAGGSHYVSDGQLGL
ncbi:P-loop containing nucleoside triphosphate hydrolase protein [Zopfia rhizophila CBS 207.26]|uniref:P-loop containing nucleoside triphosphate hydrolase protein n=1 Tax=Zopfia rhizophila CBS 207.26 TaxID=1314779 RepID=A0A6A6EDN1_9PEZI|nr:P-loop containing nucleoside triphosphate hydrolase protein [Zopfia rhizophila CBS 207.26]